jgi:nucleotide-binding universal stress UspA family protein
MYKRILLPTDGSENSKRAGKHAIWIANITGADIIILHVIETYYSRMEVLPISTLPSPDEYLYKELMEEGNKFLKNFKDDLEENQCNGKCENVKFKTLLKEGKPHLEIIKIISEENVDLVVMGASGRHGLDRFLLGSVTERVIRAAKKPVMLIP